MMYSKISHLNTLTVINTTIQFMNNIFSTQTTDFN